MWTYHQTSGMLSRDGIVEGIGYSGAEPDGKNNPTMEDTKNIGPIPRGKYTISTPFDTTTHGPHVMRLTHDPLNIMFGRDGFLMHGDSVEHPGQASEGCIIMPRNIREAVSDSTDTQLTVVA